MLTLYFAEILDYSNKPVMKLQYTASAKHSAMLATQFVRDVPPACSFTIRLIPSFYLLKIIKQYLKQVTLHTY
jgi:hypothetical protein